MAPAAVRGHSGKLPPRVTHHESFVTGFSHSHYAVGGRKRRLWKAAASVCGDRPGITGASRQEEKEEKVGAETKSVSTAWKLEDKPDPYQPPSMPVSVTCTACRSSCSGSQKSQNRGHRPCCGSAKRTNVVKSKFLCLTHSEAKQTKTSDFGAEKGLLQSQARRKGSSRSKTLNSPTVFGEKFL